MPSLASVGAVASIYGVSQYVGGMRQIARETASTSMSVRASTKAMNSNVFTNVGRSVTNLGNNIRLVGNNISQLGLMWTASVGLMAATGVGAMARSGMELEGIMQRVQHLTGASQESIAAWSQALIKLGPELGKMPTELAEGLYFIASVGIKNVSDQLLILRSSAMASSLGMGEMGQVTKAVVSILEVYGDTGIDAREATNALLVAIRLAAFEADDLVTALARVGPTAHGAGVGLGDVLGFMAAFSRDGATAAMSATALINALNFVIDPTKEAEKTLEKYNWTIERVRESIAGPNGLNGTLDILGDKMGSDIAKLFTTRATSGVFAVANMDDYRGIVKEISDATELQKGELSELEKSFSDYTSSVNFAWDATKAGLQSLAIQGFQAIKAPLASVLLQLVEFLDRLREIIYNNPQLVAMAIRFALIAAAIGPLLIILGAFLRSVGSLITLIAVPLRLVGAGFAFIQSAIAPLLGLVGGLGVGVFNALAVSMISSFRVMLMFGRQMLVLRTGVSGLIGTFMMLNRLSSGLSVAITAPIMALGGPIIYANRLFVTLMTTISKFSFGLARTIASFSVAGIVGQMGRLRGAVVGTFSSMIGIVRPFVYIWGVAFAKATDAVLDFGARVLFLFPSIGNGLSRISSAIVPILVAPFRIASAAILGVFSLIPLALSPIVSAAGAILVSLDRVIMSVLGRIAANMSITMLKLSDAVFFMLTRISGAVITAVAQTVAVALSGLLSVVSAIVPVVLSAASAAVGAIASIAAAIAAIAAPVVAVAAAIAGGILIIAGLAGAVSKTFSKIKTDINKAAPNLGGNMRAHGKNIIESFGRGMIDGAIAVVQALRYIGSIITHWLRPGSPPLLLPDLDIWGSGAMSAYMEGWSQFDFSSFKEISSKFKEFFSSLMAFDAGPLEEAGIIENLLGFRDILADAINDIDAVGYVSDSIWSAVNAGLAGASAEMQNYVRLTLMAAEAQERVKAIQEQINQTQDQFSAQLAPLDKRLADIADIRQEAVNEDRISELQRILADPRATDRAKMLAQLEIEEITIKDKKGAIEEERDKQLDALNAQLEIAQSEYELLALQADHAESLVDLQIEQNNLLRDMAQKIDEANKKEDEKAAADEGAGAADFGAGEAFPELPPPGELPGDFGNLDALGVAGPLGDLDSKMQDLKDEISGLGSEVADIAGIIWNKMNELWNSRLKPVWDSIITHPFVTEIWTTLKSTIQDTVDKFNKMRPSLEVIKETMTSLSPILSGIGLVIVALVGAFGGLVSNIGGVFGSLITRITELKPRFDAVFNGLGEVVSGFVRIFSGDVKGGLKELILGLLRTGHRIDLLVRDIFTSLLDIGLRLLASVAEFLLTFIDRILLGIQDATGINTEALRGWIASVKEKLESFLSESGSWGERLKLAISAKWESIKADAVAKWEEIKTDVSTKLEDLKTSVVAIALQIAQPYLDVVEKFRGWGEAVSEAKDKTVVPVFQEIKDKIVEFMTPIIDAFVGFGEQMSAIDQRMGELVTTITDDLKQIAKNVLGSIFEMITGVEGFEENIELFKTGFHLAWEGIKEGFSLAKLLIVTGIEALIDIIGRLSRAFAETLVLAFGKVKEWLDIWFEPLKRLVVFAVEVMIEIVKTLAEWLREKLVNAFKWLWDKAIQYITEMRASIITDLQAIIDFAGGVVDALTNIWQWLATHVFKLRGETEISAAPGPVSNIEHNATGGPIKRGHMSWVGERGVELFVPNTSGTIVPNGDLGIMNKLGNGIYVHRPAGAVMIGNSAPMLSFGDTYIDNGMQGEVLAAKIRAEVIKMLGSNR